MDRERSTRGSAAGSRAMLDAGWLDEVAGLVERGFGAWLTATQAIGYAELAAHLDGRLALDEAMTADREAHEGARAPPAWRGSVAIRGSCGSTPAGRRRRRGRPTTCAAYLEAA